MTFRIQRPHGGMWFAVDIWHLRIAAVGRVWFIDWKIRQPGNRWRIAVGPSPIWKPLGSPTVKRHRLPFGNEWIYYPRGVEA